MKKTETQISKGMMFNGAEEYFSYQGLNDGYNDLVDDSIEYVSNFPLQKLEMTRKCQNCYLLGHDLGKEIRRSNEQEKEDRRRTTSRSRRLLDGPSL